MSGLELTRRARRALERQLEYQRRKAEDLRGMDDEVIAGMREQARLVKATIESERQIPANARVLEVGSGTTGIIFFFEAAERVGVDPLADEYRKLFPSWQSEAKTIAAFGEALPFQDSSFDVVLCENVVDHAQDPRRIVEEICRVLVPGGLLYFSVNVHHPIYGWASRLYSTWRALGLPRELAPFADHTVHLTVDGARRLFDGLPFELLCQRDNVAASKEAGRTAPVRHSGDRLKRLFFKNAYWETVAVKR